MPSALLQGRSLGRCRWEKLCLKRRCPHWCEEALGDLGFSLNEFYFLFFKTLMNIGITENTYS